MRSLVEAFPGQFRRSPLATVFFLVLAAATAYETSTYILKGDLTGLAYVGIAYAIGVLVVAILHDWRNGLYFFLAWLLFEDLSRKFLGNNMAIYFAKDFLLIVVYLSFFIAYRRRDKSVQTFRPPFLRILLVFVWFGVMQVFNPASTHIVYGLLGMKLYFYYVPLIIVGYALITSESALRKFFMWTLGSGLVGGAVCLWGAPWRHGEALRIFRALQRATLGAALAVVLLLFTYPDALLNRLAVFSETLDPRSPASELVHRTRDYPLRNFLAAFDYDRWPFGYGIGTLSLGGQYVARFFHAKPGVSGVESGFGCLVIELGLSGLILWLAMSGAILWSAWGVVRKLRGSPWFPLAFMIFWYAFLLLLPLTFQGIQAYQDFILNAYLWLLLGVLFRLPKLALDAQFSATAEAAQPGSRWIR